MWWRRFRYVILLASMCAIATCPAAKRACTASARQREADQLVEYLADRAALAYASTGKLPLTAAPLTPQPSCCDQDGECAPNAASWQSAGWRALQFSIDDPHRYQYEYVPDPSGTSAVIRARGDLDCDGRPGLVEATLRVHDGKLVRTITRKPEP